MTKKFKDLNTDNIYEAAIYYFYVGCASDDGTIVSFSNSQKTFQIETLERDAKLYGKLNDKGKLTCDDRGEAVFIEVHDENSFATGTKSVYIESSHYIYSF